MKPFGREMTSENNLGKTKPVVIRMLEALLFPKKCLKCGIYMEEDGVHPHTLESCFCGHCMKEGVHPITPPFCISCGIRFHNSFNENPVCGVCLKKPLKLGQVRAVAEYKGIIQDGIQLFKYHSKLSIAKTFEHLLFQTFLQHYDKLPIDLIMPMPLHRAKMRKRGFNQAYFLSRNFKKLYQHSFHRLPSWDMDMDSLVRIKKTLPQTGFDIEERKRNLKNAFKIIREDRIKAKHILLVDDVFTTGATCNEAAKELLKKGAKRVDALVLART
jgi:ComF family protein